MKIGYLENLGKHELNKAADKWNKLYPDDTVSLKVIRDDEFEIKVENGEFDAILSNRIDSVYKSLELYPIKEIPLVGLVQNGNFNKHQQTIDIDELKNIPCILVSKIDNEKNEYHYIRDILQLDNQILAVETFGEAILMIESGSGFLVMNEVTASHIDSDQIQKLFLLRNGKQLMDNYVLIGKPKSNKIQDFSKILREVLN